MINDEVSTDVQVVRAEDILNGEKSDVDSKSTETADPMPKKNKKEKSLEQQIPKGKPKSGRTWKEERKRFSSIVKTRGTRMSLDKRQKLKDDLKRVKELSRAIKEEKRAQKEAKKERRRANLKRAEENQKKGEIVQVITNTAKLKKMKKKNLRTIQKRDTVNI